MQYRDAISIEGYLDKQSPTVFKIYQTRYFAYRNMGEFLIWFKKKPTSIDDVPKGIIKTRTIDILEDEESDERVFKIYYETRQFKLKANSRQMKEKWLKSIQAVKDHFKKTEKNQISKKEDKSISKKAWRWNDLNGQVVQKIRIQNQQLLLNEGEDNILQSSSKLLVELLHKKIGFEMERNLIFGLLNKKAFIGSETRLYFLFSEFNLYDDKDDLMNQKVRPFLEEIEKQKQAKSKIVKKQSDSDDSQPQQTPAIQSKDNFDINRLYEYDLKAKKISFALDLVDINKWKQNIEEKPLSLSINYTVYKGDVDNEQQQEKDLLLISDYLSEIKKWNKALGIVFERYSIKKQREELMEKRFVKFQIKMLKVDEQAQWRVMGTSDSPDFIYLNKEFLKVSGFMYDLSSINSGIKNEKQQIVFKQKNEEVKKETSITKISMKQSHKLQIVFDDKDLQKAFKKKLKKYLKKIESLKGEDEMNMQLPKGQIEINQNTYFMDKKIKERNGSMRVNFYEILQRDVSVSVTQKPIKQESMFGRFLNIFCGPSKEQDYLY